MFQTTNIGIIVIQLGLLFPIKILVSWDDEIPNIWKNKKCSKPPTSWGMG